MRFCQRLNPHGLHFAFLDPYNFKALPFSVIEAFARFKYIDMLIHVSVHDLQRNLDTYWMSTDGPLDRFPPGWRAVVSLKQSKFATPAAYIAYWAARMSRLASRPRAMNWYLGQRKINGFIG